eukprot:RCo053123
MGCCRSAALEVNRTLPYNGELRYQASVPSGSLPPCGSAFRDNFTVQLYDGELYDSVRTVSVVGLTCDTCPAPYVLSTQATCELCSGGLSYDPTTSPPQCSPPRVAGLGL